MRGFMADPGQDHPVDTDRPVDVETFETMGCRVALVNAVEVLAAAGAGRVELLHGASFPAPVREVRFWAAGAERDAEAVHVLEARIRTGPAGFVRDRLGFSVLGSDPLGVWLSRRFAAGEPWATRMVDGVGNAAAEVYRWVAPYRSSRTRGEADHDAPGRTRVREDPTTGLRVTVSDVPSAPGAAAAGAGGGRTLALRAEVASEVVSPAHLRAMFGLVLQVVDEILRQSGRPGALAGHSFVVGREPAGRASGPQAAGTVTLDQVGGLGAVVAEFRQVALSFQHPEVMARWGARRPQGILMYGPPGTGKTMLARALANEIGANFREIRTPEILDKWLGASERNIRRIFQAARRYREPTVLLFDEFDSIISYTGAGGDAASQAVNAVAGIFKQEMNDLIEHNPNVIVVATTNFPDRVDESLVRSGRFDIKLAIPLPGEDGRAEIISKMIQELRARHERGDFRMFADDIDPRELARASAGMTGADLKEALRRVRLDKAMREARTGAATAIGQSDLTRCIAELRGGGAGG
jgi:transitional endoplasmic reticulum ATPase